MAACRCLWRLLPNPNPPTSTHHLRRKHAWTCDVPLRAERRPGQSRPTAIGTLRTATCCDAYSLTRVRVLSISPLPPQSSSARPPSSVLFNPPQPLLSTEVFCPTLTDAIDCYTFLHIEAAVERNAHRPCIRVQVSWPFHPFAEIRSPAQCVCELHARAFRPHLFLQPLCLSTLFVNCMREPFARTICLFHSDDNAPLADPAGTSDEVGLAHTADLACKKGHSEVRGDWQCLSTAAGAVRPMLIAMANEAA